MRKDPRKRAGETVGPEKKDDAGEYYTVEEVAKKLRLTRRGVQNMCRMGRIGATRTGKLWLIPRESLDAYLRIVRG